MHNRHISSKGNQCKAEGRLSLHFDQISSTLIKIGLLRFIIPHNGTNNQHGGKTAVYLAVDTDKLQLQFLDQMGSILIQKDLERSYTPP